MNNNKETFLRLVKSLCIIFVFFIGLFAIVASGGGGGSDDNNSTNGTTYDISGYVQKGPFISGSSVTIYELDSSLNQTGVSFQTQTVDDFGSFILPKKVSSKYIEIISSGYYFNEVEGSLSTGPLTLSTISEVKEGKAIYVNILTCVADKRIKYLVQNENKSFEEALAEAESEILTIFNINETEILDFDQMDISEDGNSNAILLAVSVILQGDNTVAELSELVSKIGLDIETDGTLDNSIYNDEIMNNIGLIDRETIRNNLQNRYSSLGIGITIPTFEDYVYGKVNFFLSGLSYDTDHYPSSVATGDLDDDGDLDLVIGHWGSDFLPVSVLLNNGDGTFAPAVNYYSGDTFPHYIVIGDLNGDEDLDLTVINLDSVSVLLNKGDGTGTFATAVNYPIEGSYGPGGGLFSAVTGDLDGDGDPDLAIASAMPDNLIVLLNNGDGTFASEQSYTAYIYTRQLAAGDLDGDGDLDIAMTGNFGDFGSPSVSIYFNNGDGTFAAEVNYYAGDCPYSTAIGDLDSDGDLDLVVTDQYNGQASVFLNNGIGTFAPAVVYSGLGSKVVIGDLDGDGDLDLIGTNSALLNKGNGTIAAAVSYSSGDSPVSLATGDFDGDGDLDLAIVNELSDCVTVLLNYTIN
jgi:hypothetical protein